MSEQAQRQLAEALIDKVDRLEAENATLKQRIDGAAQIIAMRTADVTALKQERDKALKIERLALAQVKEDMVTLEIVVTERDRLQADAVTADEKYAAAINALRDAEDERDRIRASSNAINEELVTAEAACHVMQAERDRLRQALKPVADYFRVVLEKHGQPDDRAWAAFNDKRLLYGDLRRIVALSPSETEEGG